MYQHFRPVLDRILARRIKDVFPLDADNGVREKALLHYKESLIRHSHLAKTPRGQRAKEELRQKFPWVQEVFNASRNRSHPRHSDARSFIGAMGKLSRSIPYRTTKGGNQDPLPLNGDSTPQKQPPSPTSAVMAWFEAHDVLMATDEELAHFTGYSRTAFLYPIKKLREAGFVFDKNGHGTRVVQRPNNRRDEIKDEVRELLDRVRALESELGSLG